MGGRLVIVLLSLLLIAPSALAQGDPRLSKYEKDGDFTVNYYGTRRDGTVCPPSANALMITLSDGETIVGLHGLGFAEGTDPAVAAAFEGTCRVSFAGHVAVATHHGTNASIAPVSANANAVEPVYEGMFSVQYQPIMCLVAPCPAGAYAILDGKGKQIGQVDAVLVEGPAGSRISRGQYLDWESEIGAIWIDDSKLAEMLQFQAGETRARIRLKPVI